jgi:hypothetical protein
MDAAVQVLVGQYAQQRWPDIDASTVEIDQAFEADKVGEFHHAWRHALRRTWRRPVITPPKLSVSR